MSNLLQQEKERGWSNNGGAKWFIFETTAKQNKFMMEKINKFNPKVENIKESATGNVDVRSLLINSNKIHANRVDEIRAAFKGQLRVDYLLAAEIRDNNNGNFHILGGRKYEDHVCEQIEQFAEKQDLDYLLEKRILGPNGEIDIILITDNTSKSLENNLLKHLRNCDNYRIFKEKNQ